MKKILLIIPITLLALTLVIGIGNQTCLADTVPSILLIDGNDDTGTNVEFTVYDLGISYGVVAYRINGGSWQDITWTSGDPPYATFSDFYCGDTLDFQLDVQDGEDHIYFYSYESSDATVTYGGTEIDGDNATCPEWWDDQYHGSVFVKWTIDAGWKMELATTKSTDDGFAPVPIPTSVLLLGAGLLGLIGIGYRRRKSTSV